MDRISDTGIAPDPMSANAGTSGPARFDCETAVLLRAVIRPIFEQSSSWSGLIDRLTAKGYCLVFRRGALCLTDISSGARICGLRFLGLSLRDLVGRMGRPFVVARPGGMADGDILRHPPSRLTLH